QSGLRLVKPLYSLTFSAFLAGTSPRLLTGGVKGRILLAWLPKNLSRPPPPGGSGSRNLPGHPRGSAPPAGAAPRRGGEGCLGEDVPGERDAVAVHARRSAPEQIRSQSPLPRRDLATRRQTRRRDFQEVVRQIRYKRPLGRT